MRAFIVLGLVFFHTKPKDWLGETYMYVLCGGPDPPREWGLLTGGNTSNAQNYLRSIFWTLFAAGQERCCLWLPVNCSNLFTYLLDANRARWRSCAISVRTCARTRRRTWPDICFPVVCPQTPKTTIADIFPRLGLGCRIIEFGFMVRITG